VSNLWALPVGADQSLDPSQLSAGLMAPLLDRLRKNFDVVIIDTGPILGSLEANLLARLADRVLMVVSRGQSPKSVRAALQQVHRLGATCAGLVFNRAMAQDFEHSTSAGSLRSRASRPDPSWSKASIDGRPLMFAPNALVDVKGAHAPSEQTGAP
jgi:Mrp family chromosome partitioning ATPase